MGFVVLFMILLLQNEIVENIRPPFIRHSPFIRQGHREVLS